MNLTVATWNCADGFAKKRPFLAEMDADIICIQELRESAFALEAPNWPHATFAKSDTARGLAIFSRIPLTPFPMRYRKTDRAYIALQNDNFVILGAWVKPAENYVTPSQRVFRQFFRKLDRPAVILGDLNQNAVFDPARKVGLFKDTEKMMRKADLRSLYHHDTGHAFGQEAPTHWLTFSEKRPYHLDYIWASHAFKLTRFELFPTDPWLTARRSDHLPMRASLSLHRDAATTAK
ncbi:MAG: endonuclease/exonuclease/phosphatase family protein [Pseudomonadota bacterium]